MSLFRHPDLNAPKGEDELEYTPLQLTRLRHSAIEFQKFVIAALALIVVASFLFVAITLSQQHAKTHDQCVSSNSGRAAIKDAFDDLYDGFIKASGNSPAAVEFKKARMESLEKRLPQRDC